MDAAAVLEERAGLAYCYLSTTGRRSGRDHTIEIWFAVSDGVLHLISGGGDRSDWVRNLLHDPSASVRVGDDVLAVRADVPLAFTDERTRAVRALHAKYGQQVSGTEEQWQRDAYIVTLRPV